MKRTLFVVAALAGLAATLSTAPGCSMGAVFAGNVLSYEQYLSIDQDMKPTPTADTVLQALGMPKTVHDRNGVRRRIDYNAKSLTGDLKTAEFTFDENEKLVKKELW